MSPLLEEAHSKAEHAKAHISHLADYLRDWSALNLAQGLLITEFMQAERDYFTIRLGSMPLPGHEASLIAGAAVHDLRCALDYLAWRLFLDGSAAKSHDRPNDVQFPIVSAGRTKPGKAPKSAADVFEDQVARRLPGVASDLVDVVRSVQPFVVHPPNPEAHPLAVMHKFSNDDKHHHLRLTMTTVNTLDWRLVEQKNFQATKIIARRPAPSFQSGAEIGRVEGVAVGEGEPDVQVEGRVEGRIVFTGTDIGARNGLTLMANAVLNVLHKFDPLL